MTPTEYKPLERICDLCQDTGLVIREMTFRACVCKKGRRGAGQPWSFDGQQIMPEDMPTVGNFRSEADYRAFMAKLLTAGRAATA